MRNKCLNELTFEAINRMLAKNLDAVFKYNSIKKGSKRNQDDFSDDDEGSEKSKSKKMKNNQL
jgi:hypothetical protein